MIKNFLIILTFIFFIECKTINNKLFKIDKSIINSIEPDFKVEKLISYKNEIILCGTNLNKLQLLKCDSSTKIDQTFGPNGSVIINAFETTKLIINDIIINEENNNIIVSGVSYNKNNKTQVIIFKFDTFGNLLFISLVPIDNIIKTFDLKINKYGYINLGIITKDNISIIKCNQEGHLNKNFGHNGIMSFEIPKNLLLHFSDISSIQLKLGIQKNNQLIIGYTDKNQFNLIRLTDKGGIDNSFNLNFVKNCKLNDITIQNDDKIIICNSIEQTNSIFLTRLEENGQIDSTFKHINLPNIYSNQNINMYIDCNNQVSIYSNAINNYLITTYKIGIFECIKK